MRKRMLEDKNGNRSSKRVAGLLALLLGLMMGVYLFYFSLVSPIGDSSTAIAVMNMFLMSGGALLGIGVLETKK